MSTSITSNSPTSSPTFFMHFEKHHGHRADEPGEQNMFFSVSILMSLSQIRYPNHICGHPCGDVGNAHHIISLPTLLKEERGRLFSF